MNKAVYVVITADKWLNAFMNAADLFEKGKSLGVAKYVTVTFEPGVHLTLSHPGLATEYIVEALSKANNVVSFVHLIYIQHGDTFEENTGTIRPYYNSEVRIISNGEKWFMLDDFLRRLGFTVTTDQWRYIKELKYG